MKLYLCVKYNAFDFSLYFINTLETNSPFDQTLSIFNAQNKVACCHHCSVALEPVTEKEKWAIETVNKSLPHWNELEKTVSCSEALPQALG